MQCAWLNQRAYRLSLIDSKSSEQLRRDQCTAVVLSTCIRDPLTKDFLVSYLTGMNWRERKLIQRSWGKRYAEFVGELGPRPVTIAILSPRTTLDGCAR
jgi:hypothetical protein